MMSEKYSWENTSSSNRLEVDWEYRPTPAQGMRSFARMDVDDLSYILDMNKIMVQVAAPKTRYTGELKDLSKGGLAIQMHKALKLNERVNVGLTLGKEKIISHAIVKQNRAVDEKFLVGMEFVNLDEEMSDFISGIYASTALRII